jgi:hypothetical protein
VSSAARRNVRATADTPAARENALLAAAMAKLNRSSVVWPKVSLCLSVSASVPLCLCVCASLSLRLCLSSQSLFCAQVDPIAVMDARHAVTRAAREARYATLSLFLSLALSLST